MTDSASDNVDPIEKRIAEFGDKSTQLLLFLSFAIVGAATLYHELATKIDLIRSAITFWIFSIFPVLLGVVPLKDFMWENRSWYAVVRWVKFALLWLAIIVSGVGTAKFWLAMVCLVR